ncbi:MAG: SDR family NAD(P)-dependent oxidoreductase [Chloroflexota bacterium]
MEHQTENIETIQLRRAIQAIEKMESELREIKYRQHEPIAIIGMGCRYPGGPLGDIETPEQYWAGLLAGFDGIVDLPEKRRHDLYGQHHQPHQYAQRSGFLSQVDQFDPTFFGLSAREVLLMDPVHRLLLETVWHALEDAHIIPQALLNSEVGVFMGTPGASGYEKLCTTQDQSLYKSTGRSSSAASGRISFLLGLTGPCISVDTACSSSLVAVHQACQSLRNGECNMALAGGVNLLLDDEPNEIFGNSNMLSGDAHCKTFDAAADGYVSGEGCGVVVLKRLSDAQANQDTIIALIQGTSINQDGPSGGLTVPNGPSQQRVIQRALDDAGLNPDQIGYIEAHGTGTPLGDPIEIGALNAVFKERTQPLYVGSVKTNFGHLEFAAGIAGLMKVALAVHHGQIPPHLHFHTPNPHINWDGSPVHVPTDTMPWMGSAEGEKRIGGVSSFGYSGTNAHLILAEPPNTKVATSSSTSTGTPLVHERPLHLLTISAKQKDVLRTYTHKYAEHLQTHPDIDLGDLCYTSHVGRSHFDHRLTLTAPSTEAMQKLLKDYANSPAEQPLPTGVSQLSRTSPQERPKIAFLFTGQGAQYVGMGQELYQTEPTFRDVINRCDVVFQEVHGRSLIELLYPESEPLDNDLMESPPCLTAAIFAIECALVEVWWSWGITPDIVLGHSLGDYAAAHTAGIFSLEDGLRLVTRRGELMAQALGSMVAVLASEADVLSFIENYKDITIGVINGPTSIVLSGRNDSITKVTEELQVAGFKTRILNTPVANHSPLLDPVLDDFEQAVQNATLHSPKLKVISSMTGQLTTDELTNPTYWRQHLRNTVRFADGVTTLHEQGVELFIEIGPGATLLRTIHQAASGKERRPKGSQIEDAANLRLSTLQPLNFPAFPSLRKSKSDWQQMLESLGELYVHGVEIDWIGFEKGYMRQKVALPTYPFQRQRYWVEPTDDQPGTQAVRQSTRQPDSRTLPVQAKNSHILDWFYAPRWEQTLLLIAQNTMSMFAQQACWLLFVDECGLGDQLAEHLEQVGQIVIKVHAGTTFESHDSNTYTLDPQRQDDYEVFIRTLILQGKQPQHILHLWQVTPSRPVFDPFDETTLNRELDLGFYSLLFLTQALDSIQEYIALSIVTNHLHAVTGDEEQCPVKATLLGLMKVISQEYPNRSCRGIDIQLPSELGNPSSLASSTLMAQLMTELSNDMKDVVSQEQENLQTSIAYRGRHRWVQTFQPLSFSDESLDKKPLRVKEKGVYLITGGLGGIGLTLAAYLATFQTKLILVDRKSFPKRQTWAGWLANHDADDKVCHQIHQIQEMEALGAEILVLSADVASYSEIEHAIAEGTTQFGAIHGVIHAAGVVGSGPIHRKTKNDARRVLAPKVQGTFVLDALLHGIPLDFFILCSSLSTVSGGLWLCDDAAANAFLDAYARSDKANISGARLTLSINWDDWQEVGIEVETETSKGLNTRQVAMQTKGILPPEGERILNALLHYNLPQVVVSTMDLHTALNAQSHNNANHHPQHRNAYVAPQSEIERLLVNIYQEALGIEPIGIYDNFFAFGGDSVLAIQMLTRIRHEFQLDVALDILYEKSTIYSLSEHMTLIKNATDVVLNKSDIRTENREEGVL